MTYFSPFYLGTTVCSGQMLLQKNCHWPKPLNFGIKTIHFHVKSCKTNFSRALYTEYIQVINVIFHKSLVIFRRRKKFTVLCIKVPVSKPKRVFLGFDLEYYFFGVDYLHSNLSMLCYKYCDGQYVLLHYLHLIYHRVSDFVADGENNDHDQYFTLQCFLGFVSLLMQP